MNQQDRINSVSNDWEADPWDASDEVADAQLSGFKLRANKPLEWIPIRTSGQSIFGIDVSKLTSADVKFYTTHDGEEMLLMQLTWHGWPDPPEWRLASRPHGSKKSSWSSWGYFSELPRAWTMPEASKS
ncbi:MAG: hypothetical protein BGO57_12435 [Sphingomonadales bacterium 63-6]|nr:MAG: hypothetical protein BGO57_12435 [Sphingomonadales bacterium 63-6]